METKRKDRNLRFKYLEILAQQISKIGSSLLEPSPIRLTSFTLIGPYPIFTTVLSNTLEDAFNGICFSEFSPDENVSFFYFSFA